MKILVIVVLFISITNCLTLSIEHFNIVMYKTFNDYRIITVTTPERILQQDIFNKSLKTVFFTPGTNTTIQSPKIRSIIEAYIKSNEYNIIQLDSSYYTLNAYHQPVGWTYEILFFAAKIYSAMISKLIYLGLDMNNIELIGHSFGANLALLIAKFTTPKLPLLIGLDPPNWYRFEKGYAKYTIALHTNIGFASFNYNMSDSDMIANNGSIQAQCTDRSIFELPLKEIFDVCQCSHLAAISYWSGMIENPELFYGVKCNGIYCNYDKIEQLGPNLRKPGVYYFNTMTHPPFGLGLDGIQNIIPIENTMQEFEHELDEIIKKHFI